MKQNNFQVCLNLFSFISLLLLSEFVCAHPPSPGTRPFIHLEGSHYVLTTLPDAAHNLNTQYDPTPTRCEFMKIETPLPSQKNSTQTRRRAFSKENIAEKTRSLVNRLNPSAMWNNLDHALNPGSKKGSLDPSTLDAAPSTHARPIHFRMPQHKHHSPISEIGVSSQNQSGLNPQVDAQIDQTTEFLSPLMKEMQTSMGLHDID